MRVAPRTLELWGKISLFFFIFYKLYHSAQVKAINVECFLTEIKKRPKRPMSLWR